MLRQLILEPGDHEAIATLRQLKRKLNRAKSQLDCLSASQLSRWQRQRDPYRDLCTVLRQQYGVEHVSNAWLKYWEIFKTLPLLPAGEAKVFFNAELPGSALCALLHLVQTDKLDTAVDWRASSLVPRPLVPRDHSNAKDQFLEQRGPFGDTYGLWARNPERWLMSEANDGDCTRADTLLDFERRLGPASEFGGVHFYSDDAAMSVGHAFAEQESGNAQLHLGCALAGFLTLRPGGCFVAKQFTLFEPLTWSLLRIYARLFARFSLFKPLASRARNSEVYLIGEGFRGLDAETRALLFARLEAFHMTPLDDLPPPQGLLEFVEAACAQQIASLDGAVGKSQMAAMQTQLWLEAFPVQRADQVPCAKSEARDLQSARHRRQTAAHNGRSLISSEIK